MLHARSTQAGKATEPESLSLPHEFACESACGKVFWLQAQHRRPGCKHAESARVLVNRGAVQVAVFADPNTSPEKLRELAMQAELAVRGDLGGRWRTLDAWIARRIEHAWARRKRRAKDADELLLAILDAFPIRARRKAAS